MAKVTKSYPKREAANRIFFEDNTMLDHIKDSSIHLTKEEKKMIEDMLKHGSGTGEVDWDKIDKLLKGKADINHTHNYTSEDIKETDNKKFVSKQDIDNWNNMLENNNPNHIHNNISVLNKITEDSDGNPLYDGKSLKGKDGEQGPAGIFNINEIYETLQTNDKSVLGAINELFEMIKSLKPAPPEESKMYYGFIPYEVTGKISNYNEITKQMLLDSRSKIITALPSKLNKTSIGIVPEGGLIVIALPSSCNLTASKDNGIGNRVTFTTSQGIPNANGIEVMLDGIPYKLYGEMLLIDGEIFIYID